MSEHLVPNRVIGTEAGRDSSQGGCGHMCDINAISVISGNTGWEPVQVPSP